MLDLADLQTLAARCAPSIAPATLLAVVKAESGFDPLAIGVNGPGGGPVRSRRPEEAVRRAKALIATGRSVDLGLGQINSRNLGWLGLTVEAAFDPCRNLAAAARVLEDGWRRAGSAAPQARLRTALSFYNTGHPTRGARNGYVARVVRAAAQVVPALEPVPGAPATTVEAPRPAAEPPLADPPAPPATWDVFARARAAGPAFLLKPAGDIRP